MKALHTRATKNEQVKRVGNEIYVYHVDGMGKARLLTHGVLERVLRVKVTMRNWNTSSRLLEMAGEKPWNAKVAEVPRRSQRKPEWHRVRFGRIFLERRWEFVPGCWTWRSGICC